MRLTQEQCETYRSEGVLIVKNALTDEDLQPVIDEISGWISERALALKQEGKIEDLYEDEPFDRRFGKLLAQSGEMVSGLDIMHYSERAVVHDPSHVSGDCKVAVNLKGEISL